MIPFSHKLNKTDKKINPKTYLIIISLIIAATTFYFLSLNQTNNDNEENQPDDVDVKEVTVQPLGDLVKDITIDKTAIIKPATSASLIARTGGRVTKINRNLGETVFAGQKVAGIDTGVVANPTQAQLVTARQTMQIFDDIKQEALEANDNAIETAKISLEAAQDGKRLSKIQAEERVEQAELSLRQAELSYQDATEAEERKDQVVRAADIGLKAAKIALNQAKIGEDIANQQAGDAFAKAKQGLETARQSKEKTKVELSKQRISLAGQVSVLSEQLKLSQVIAPVSGQLTGLDINEGDFTRAGQKIGEIISFNGARININVNTGTHNKLSIGQEVTIKSRDQEFTGKITYLADGPSSNVALWQVNIKVDSTPQVIHPGELVTVQLPVGASGQDTVFIPLDVITTREKGNVIMTINEGGQVEEHSIKTISYSGDFVEADVDLTADTKIITSSNKTLRAGDAVQVKP